MLCDMSVPMRHLLAKGILPYRLIGKQENHKVGGSSASALMGVSAKSGYSPTWGLLAWIGLAWNCPAPPQSAVNGTYKATSQSTPRNTRTNYAECCGTVNWIMTNHYKDEIILAYASDTGSIWALDDLHCLMSHSNCSGVQPYASGLCVTP